MSSHRVSINKVKRGGSTYLEIQVALLVFAVGMSGLVPLTVINTRQSKALNAMVPAGVTRYLVPPVEKWAAKLGAPAQIASAPLPATPPPVELVDEQDAGFALDGTVGTIWSLVSSSTAYRGQFLQTTINLTGSRPTWTLTNLEPYLYEVFVTYPNNILLAENAQFLVYDDKLERGSKRINQKFPPSGPIHDGVAWDSLGRYLVKSGTLRVILNDKANGLLAADAVRVVQVKNGVQVVSVEAEPQKHMMTVTVMLKLAK